MNKIKLDKNNNLLRLRFKYWPEYLKLGSKLIIDETFLKATGYVKELHIY
jgi:hypothetical protein